MRILFSLFLLFAGIGITLKADWFYENFGTIPFFEKYFHSSGGGRFGYRMVGIGTVLVGILVLTNIHAQILQAIASLFVFGQN